MQALTNTELITHSGGCHCGAIQFQVLAPADITAQLCNCSICSKTAYLHLIVPRSRFTLLSGEGNLSEYTFDTHEAKHLFCKVCGIKSYYIPRSNPDGVSVNVRCLNEQAIGHVKIELFDGRNWDANAHELSHLSRECDEKGE